MHRSWNIALAVALFVFAFTASVECRRTFSSSRHSYPSHGGRSGTGHAHSYPASPGLSGTHSTQNQHATSQHSSPLGNAAGGGGGGAHTYPNSPGLSGNNGHSYPHSPGLSGGAAGYPSHAGNTPHHVYNPPPQIHYTPVHGAPPAHPYPVYHGTPPVYVHEIRDSGSQFGTLLTGLALYNLGRSALHSNHGTSSPTKTQDAKGEKCALHIVQDLNEEQVKIPCYIISTFTDASDVKAALPNATSTAATPAGNSSEASTPTPAPTSVTPITRNETVINTLPANVTSEVVAPDVNNTSTTTAEANVTSTTPLPPVTPQVAQNATANAPELVDALKVKGEPLKLSKDARCFVERRTPTAFSKKEVECGLLQQYAVQSMQTQSHRASAASVLLSHVSLCALSLVTYLIV